jgi:hypothetical protein
VSSHLATGGTRCPTHSAVYSSTTACMQRQALPGPSQSLALPLQQLPPPPPGRQHAFAHERVAYIPQRVIAATLSGLHHVVEGGQEASVHLQQRMLLLGGRGKHQTAVQTNVLLPALLLLQLLCCLPLLHVHLVCLHGPCAFWHACASTAASKQWQQLGCPQQQHTTQCGYPGVPSAAALLLPGAAAAAVATARCHFMPLVLERERVNRGRGSYM